MHQTQQGSGSLRRRSFRAAGITLASVFSLLMWSRLKMVTDTPRMVYADPKSAETTGGEPQSTPGTDRNGAPQTETEPTRRNGASHGRSDR